MRLSTERVQELQLLLKTELGLELDYEQAQHAGLAIMRFVTAKERRSAINYKGRRHGANKQNT